MSTRLTLSGDVLPAREDAETLFEPAAPYMEGALNFCQLETCMATSGSPRRDVLTPMRVPPDRVDALVDAGYDIVSFAGNNNLDYGDEAFLDTIDLLEEHDIEVVGAGRDLDGAREPVVIEREGVRIAFVACCSILRQGYEATEYRPGISPLEVMTFYQPNENIREQPGTPARTVTVPDHNDRRAVMDAIRVADDVADVTVASFHWGVHFCHDLANYQPELAYDAVDAGADLVVGTHPHVLQAVDTYDGAPILYSLGNFAFEIPPRDEVQRGSSTYKSFYGLEKGSSPISRETALVECELSEEGIEETAIRPGIVNRERQPVLLEADDEPFEEVAEFIVDLSEPYGTAFRRDGGRLTLDHDACEDVDSRAVVRDRALSYPSGFVFPSHDQPEPERDT